MTRTLPPPVPVVLYDGACVFCTRAARRLGRWMGEGRAELLSFRDPGVLDRFPGVSAEQCEAALQFVSGEGRVSSGAEGFVRALQARWWGRPLLAYYLPGVRAVADALYRRVARNRFRFLGRDECAGGACALPPGRG